MAKLSAFTKNNLTKQGFGKLDEEAKTLIFTQNFCSEKAERKGERHR